MLILHPLSDWLRAEPRSGSRSRHIRCAVETWGRGAARVKAVEPTGARVAVVQFPGTNCERETVRALQAVGCLVDVIWHADEFPQARYAAVVLPGGFAHGD